MAYDSDGNKVCNKCGEHKAPTSEFWYKNKDGADGFRSDCKNCNLVTGAKWRADHPLPIRESPIKYDTDGNRVCVKCGTSRPPTNEFWYKNKGNRDGFCSSCKNCCAENAAKYRPLYYSKHREERERYRAQYCIAHREERASYNAKYYAEHRDAHRASRLADMHRRRSRTKALTHTLTSQQWHRALEYFGGLCPYCNKALRLGQTWAYEHVVPTVKGGGYDVNNIIPACHSMKGALDRGCNGRKHDRDLEEFCLTEFGTRKGRQAIKRIQTYFEWVKKQDEVQRSVSTG